MKRKQRAFYSFLFTVGVFVCSSFLVLVLYPDITKKDGTKGNCGLKGEPKLCLVVPFRDRFDELLVFVPHMKQFLCEQRIDNEFIVINQIDSLRFNRGSLINIGYLLSRKEEHLCDYIAMHDVDLLPMVADLSYSYPIFGPFHVSAPNLHPRYHYKKFIGGILLISNQNFELVNGMSNNFWGWGREDDEFFMRLEQANLKVGRPLNITTGNKTFKHLHNKYRRPRDNIRFGDQKDRSRELDKRSGLNTTAYDEISRHVITIDGYPATVVNVELRCDIVVTPWCMDLEQLKNHVKKMRSRISSREFESLLASLHEHNIDFV